MDKEQIVKETRVKYAADLFRTVAFTLLGAGAFAIGTSMGTMDCIAYGCLTLLVYGIVGKGIEALTIRNYLDDGEDDFDGIA